MRTEPMNEMSRTALPHPTPLHLRVRITEALERAGFRGAKLDAAIVEGIRIANTEHRAAKEAAE